VLALKPTTYMNRSGVSVGEAMAFFKLKPGQVIVIHDELDLAPGKVRVKTGGGSAGHNGLRSIDAHIGSDYRRVRLGIGRPEAREAGHAYVLRDFTGDDQQWLDRLLPALADAAALLVAGEDNRFMNRVAVVLNPRPKPPAPKDENGSDGI
jgi:PTH1 family peptidyl-tRNA hydrolase